MSRRMRDGWIETPVGTYLYDCHQVSGLVSKDIINEGKWLWRVYVRQGHEVLRSGKASSRAAAMVAAEKGTKG